MEHESIARDRPLKIAFIADQTAPTYIGGYETRIWELATRLAAEGHRVHIFTSCGTSESLEAVTFHKVLAPQRFFKRSGFRDLKISALFSFMLLWQVRKAYTFDIIDANAIPWLHLPIAWLLAWRWRAKLVVSAHEALAIALPSYFKKKNVPLPKLQARIARKVYLATQNLGSAIVATSPSCVKTLRNEGNSKPIHLITSGQDCFTSLDEESRTGPPAIVFTGRIVQMKRLDILLNAIAIAAIRAKVRIVGDGPLFPELKTMLAMLNLQNVELLGRVVEQEKARILRRSSIFVLPSYREGWSLSTLEAMGHGCVPVYAISEKYDTGVKFYTTPGHDSITFDGTSIDLSAKLTALLSEPANLLRLRQNALETAQQYSWDKMISAAVTVYRSVVQ